MLRHIADTLSDTRPDTTDHPGPESGTFNVSLNASQNIDTWVMKLLGRIF